MSDTPVHPMNETKAESTHAGWTIIHRTLAEYDKHFPLYGQTVGEALQRAFPEAEIRHETFLESSEEPVLIAPEGSPTEERTSFKDQVRTAWDKATSSMLTTPTHDQSPPSSGEETDPTEHKSPPINSDTPHPDSPESTNPSPPTTPASAPPGAPTVRVDAIDSSWLVVIPMFQLEISDDPPIGGSWQVGHVTFVSRNELASHLQPPNVPRLPRPELWQQVTADVTAFALVNRTGTPTDIRRSVFREVREAANILASTAAFYGKRHHSCGFTLRGYPFHTAKHDSFFETTGTAFSRNWNQRGMLMPFELDTTWHNAITMTESIQLFDRITDTAIESNWRRQIASGAAMLGRSLMSLDLADAFLLDVIGLETLLTRRNERNGRRLAHRLKGMTGWHLRNARPGYEDEIRRIHDVRCEIVHDSDYSNLTIELLLQADMYLANSLLNIVRFPGIFPDKDTLATTLDDFATNENWPADGSLPFQWIGNSQFSNQDLDLPLW